MIGMLPHHFTRVYHVFLMYQYCKSGWPITMSVCAWVCTEVVRFPFYTFKSQQKGWLGHLRYNAFLILYPVGGFAEFMSAW